MNRDDVIRLFREANRWDVSGFSSTLFELERFAAAVAAVEREACAQVIEDFGQNGSEYAPVLPYLTRKIREREKR